MCWIQTVYGHFSIVCASDRSAAKGSKLPTKVDLGTMMVRVRLRSHLEQLIDAFPEILSGSEIVDTPHNDYRFRILISRIQFSGLMGRLADEVTYSNFKSAVAAREGSSPYEKALHYVWGIFARMQVDAYPPKRRPQDVSTEWTDHGDGDVPEGSDLAPV